MKQTFTYICPNEDATAELAERLAEVTVVGDVWALYGTLGMGKSVFARAFIRHLCSVEDVPSPTFTLVQTYSAPEFDIYHYDLYRLKSPEEIWELNIEEAIYGGVCLIEWPEKMGVYLPRSLFRVEILPHPEGGRIISVSTDSDLKAVRLASVQGGVHE